MVGRAFLEALKFGGPGGAALSLAMIGLITAADDGAAPMSAFDWAVAALTAALYGAAIGFAVAYMAALLASMGADVSGQRWVGVFVAGCLTLAVGSLLLGPSAVVAAVYAAIVAWFRVPKILAR